MTLPKEFKEAISNLPHEEKDKLIFRLLKKDLALTNRLFFELLSDESVDDKRDKLQKALEFELERATKNFYSPGYLTMDVRDMSGMINEHVSITKDKFGEAWLNLFILIKILEKNNNNLRNFKPAKTDKFYTAIIARIFKILMIIKKLHQDYLIEFVDALKELGNQITEIPELLRAAINNGLDINWLVNGDIPEDIADIHKKIRELGFLK